MDNRTELLRRAESGLRQMRRLVKHPHLSASHLDLHSEAVAGCVSCDAARMLAYYADGMVGGLAWAIQTGKLRQLPPLRTVLRECRGTAWRMFPDDDRAMRVEAAWLELTARGIFRDGRAEKIFAAVRGVESREP